MRWLKHLTTACEDETMSALIEEFGAEGYGIFWIVLEKIGLLLNEKNNHFLRYSVKKWASFCGVSPKKFQKVVEFLANPENFRSKKPVFFLKKEGKFLEISCPKLLKFRDEYTKKKARNSGQTPDKLRTNSGQTPAQRTEEETEEEENRREEEKEYYCSEMKNIISEPSAELTPDSSCHLPKQAKSKSKTEIKSVLKIPLIPKDGEYSITHEQIEEWQETYPAVDVVQELKKMRQWCLANPKRKKTARGVLRFITSWLAKEQDRGGVLRHNRHCPKGGNGGFHVPPGTVKAHYYFEITENLGMDWHESMDALFDQNGNAKDLEKTVQVFDENFAIGPPNPRDGPFANV